MALQIFKNKKLRPWIIGGVVLVGGLVLFVMLRAKGSGSAASAGGGATGPSEQLQAMQLQTGAQTTQAQLAANVQMAGIAAEAESYRYGQDTALAMAGLDAQNAQYMAMAQSTIQLAGIDAQKSVAMAQENTAQYGIAAQASVQQAGILSQQNIAQYQYQFLTEQEKQETAREGARLSSSNKQNKSNNTSNLIGGIIGGVLSIFSDARLKKDVTWTGENTVRLPQGRGFDAYGRYTYSYINDTAGNTWTGAMAQEVRRVAPSAVVTSRSSRYLALDYGALPA